MNIESQNVPCPYCSQSTELVGGHIIYPHRQDLSSRLFYLCEPCDAYCGTHKGTNEPLGTPAIASVRKLRSKCHREFDKLWKKEGMRRRSAYSWLQMHMLLSREDAHIGKFTKQQCRDLLKLLQERKQLPHLQNSETLIE